MQRDEALRILSALRPTMVERFGVKRIRLFGSTARDEAREDSDVDVLVDFERPATFDGYFGLLSFLEDQLGVSVDLVTEKGLKERVRPNVEQDAIHIA